MDAKDRSEQSAENNGICSLEWIAWAIDAARRHKEDEQRQLPHRPVPRVVPPRIEAASE